MAAPTHDVEWARTIHLKLAKEMADGGELKNHPCPNCKLPLCKRSDYTRCQRCGINWMDGEDLSKLPLTQREPYIGSKQRQKAGIVA